MESIEDILAGDGCYAPYGQAGESDDQLLAEMAAGHVDEMSVAGKRPRPVIPVPIVQPSRADSTETAVDYEPVLDELPEPCIAEIVAERETLLTEPDVFVKPAEPDELSEATASPVESVVRQPHESGQAASILVQIVWVLVGCGASGVLYRLLLM